MVLTCPSNFSTSSSAWFELCSPDRWRSACNDQYVSSCIIKTNMSIIFSFLIVIWGGFGKPSRRCSDNGGDDDSGGDGGVRQTFSTVQSWMSGKSLVKSSEGADSSFVASSWYIMMLMMMVTMIMVVVMMTTMMMVMILMSVVEINLVFFNSGKSKIVNILIWDLFVCVCMCYVNMFRQFYMFKIRSACACVLSNETMIAKSPLTILLCLKNSENW